MERLTRKDKCKLSNGEEIVICKHDKPDCNDSCMKIQPCKWYKKVQDKLWEYENAEEQGLLLRLPCKVGDTVYRIENGKITQTKITKYDIYADGSIWFSFSTSLSLPMSKFKTCIFLTQAEAEQKLKEMES